MHMSNQLPNQLPPHLQQRLQSELKPGETLLWSGQPNATRFMRSGFITWLFFIPWTAFALFWVAGAAGFRWPSFDGLPSLFPLFGLPFVLIGVGGLCAPLWLRRKARWTVYALTNRRVITIEGTRSITVRALTAADIKRVERTEHRDGSGDLVLRLDAERDSEGNRSSARAGFFGVPNVRQLERLVETFLQDRAS